MNDFVEVVSQKLTDEGLKNHIDKQYDNHFIKVHVEPGMMYINVIFRASHVEPQWYSDSFMGEFEYSDPEFPDNMIQAIKQARINRGIDD
jgi:hypothetical protein